MSAEVKKDWGENGITPERTVRTKAELLRNAEIMEGNAAKYAECLEAREVLKKADGKKITRRLYDKLCAAFGAERIDYQWGGHGWRGFTWKDETFIDRHFSIKAPNDGCGYLFDMPIKGDSCDCLDAAATVAEWDKLAEQWRGWARGNRAAAECVEFAASEYNAIWARARAACAELERRCKDSGLINAEITILCAFDGDIYDRINPFRWHESKAIDV